MSAIDTQYEALCRKILFYGSPYKDKSRANIQMRQIPHHVLDYEMCYGFPLLTTKRIFWKTVAHEFIWMLSGETNIDYLLDNNVKIWTQDANNYSGGSEVGRIYGAQWRFWTSYRDRYVDQIGNLVHNMKTNFYSRRHIVTAWNPDELTKMALPPCHWSFEIIPTNATGFALKWHQRSCDVFLGIPFDIASYAFMGCLLAKETGKRFDRLIGDLSCVHFYEPHVPKVNEQLSRMPIPCYPVCEFAEEASVDNIDINMISISNYEHHRAIKAPMFAKVQTNEDS